MDLEVGMVRLYTTAGLTFGAMVIIGMNIANRLACDSFQHLDIQP